LIRGIVIKGANELPVSRIYEVFKPQIGKVLNSMEVIESCHKLNQWYDSQKIPVDFSDLDVSDGIFSMTVEESRIGEVEIRYLDRKTGEPTEGRVGALTPGGCQIGCCTHSRGVSDWVLHSLPGGARLGVALTPGCIN
jgi:hypothetical protein